MPKLILVRHSVSTQDHDLPPHEWGLTEEGQQRCLLLAEHLRPHAPTRLIASVEPKARQTAELTAQALGGGLPVQVVEGLHEHERHYTPWFERVEDFQAAVKDIFDQPSAVVFGEESADACYARYAAAVDTVLDTFPDETLAVVSHGTVMALFMGRRSRQNPYTLWQGFKMPALAVLDLPSFDLVQLVNDVRQ